MAEETLDTQTALESDEVKVEAKDIEASAKKEKSQDIRYQKAKTKAEEAEAKLKKLKEDLAKATSEETEEPPKKVETPTLSSKDLYALIDAKVPQEDLDEVVEYAKFKEISVGEALKSGVVKTLLSENAEARKVESATHTGPTKQSKSSSSGEAILKKLEAGEEPESDEDIAKLVEARLNRGIKKDK